VYHFSFPFLKIHHFFNLLFICRFFSFILLSFSFFCLRKAATIISHVLLASRKIIMDFLYYKNSVFLIILHSSLFFERKFLTYISYTLFLAALSTSVLFTSFAASIRTIRMLYPIACILPLFFCFISSSCLSPYRVRSIRFHLTLVSTTITTTSTTQQYRELFILFFFLFNMGLNMVVLVTLFPFMNLFNFLLSLQNYRALVAAS